MGFADTAWGLHVCVPALSAPWRRIWAALARTDADSAGRPKIGGRGRGEAPLSAGKKMSHPVRRGCSEGGGRLLQHTRQEAQDLSDFSIWRQIEATVNLTAKMIKMSISNSRLFGAKTRKKKHLPKTFLNMDIY